MKIIFSRHAKRRMQLYGIDEKDVLKIVKEYSSDRVLSSGKHETVDEAAKGKYGYPLKAAFLLENDNMITRTAYPLRKERPR